MDAGLAVIAERDNVLLVGDVPLGFCFDGVVRTVNAVRQALRRAAGRLVRRIGFCR